MSGEIVCGRCVHYEVTWDARLPHGCRLFAIKSAEPPSRIVQRNSGGKPCQGFAEKRKKPAEPAG